MNAGDAAPVAAGGDEPSLLFRLVSIVEPIELGALFPTAQPLEVELGCGDGGFLLARARQHPERNFIGVERLLGRLRKIDRKGRRLGLTNLRGVRIEASYFVEYLLPPASLAALHLYFPDPWPKRRHHRRRLVNERFPHLAHRVLAPGGVVYLRTDFADYFAQMERVFAAHPDFEPVPTPPELAAELTDFEREFLAQGRVTHRAAYRARPARA
jgi:tRNA (guanine-N7-)-methyltransferase